MLRGAEELQSEDEDDENYEDGDDEDYEVGEDEDEEGGDDEGKRKEESSRRRKERRTKDKDQDDEEGGEGPSAGDVFALEMELNRENKKMMKVSLLVCLSDRKSTRLNSSHL